MIVFLTWFLWIIIHKAFYCKTINNRNLWKSDWWYCLSKYLGTISKLPNLLLSFWTYKYQNGCAPPNFDFFSWQIGRYEIRNIFSKPFKTFLLFDLEFEFRDLILMEKIPHTPYVSVLIHLKFVVSVSVTVSAESIGQLEFRFRYRAETKIVVSVVH